MWKKTFVMSGSCQKKISGLTRCDLQTGGGGGENKEICKKNYVISQE